MKQLNSKRYFCILNIAFCCHIVFQLWLTMLGVSFEHIWLQNSHLLLLHHINLLTEVSGGWVIKTNGLYLRDSRLLLSQNSLAQGKMNLHQLEIARNQVKLIPSNHILKFHFVRLGSSTYGSVTGIFSSYNHYVKLSGCNYVWIMKMDMKLFGLQQTFINTHLS